MLPLTKAWAAESLIFENDSTRPFNARTLIINNLDRSGDLTLQFGKTLNEQLFWDTSASKFKFTDDVDVQGTMSGTALHAAGGNVTISTDGTAIFNVNENAVNFRIATDNQTNMFFINGTNDRIGIKTSSPDTELEVVGTASGKKLHAQDHLTSSGALTIEGAAHIHGAATFDSTIRLNGVTYTFPGADGSNGQILQTDGAGTLSWAVDAGGISQSAADDRYVNQSGDTMTGNLVIGNASTLSVSGALITEGNLTINQDNGATDAILTFGNDAAAETLRFSDSTNQFEFSDDVEVQGTLSGSTIHAQDSLTSSGSLSIEGAATFGSTLNVGGVTYTFPGADGSASGRILSTDGSGQLSWALIGTGSLQTRERKIFVPLDTAAITTDGTDNEVNVFVGSQTGSTVNPHQYYRVSTGSGQLQDTDIRIKVLMPKDFVDFTSTNDLSFTYRTQAAGASTNKLDILVEDDDGDDAFTAADGQGLANTSWTVYTDEFDGGSFDPVRGEYIHITIKGYTTSSGMAYAGEVVLTYMAR